jgi:light-regulated signal transduction histidine kinase (bacteriophytochrome)
MSATTAKLTVMDPISASESAEERVKILLVDDQPDNLLSAEAVLESLGEEIIKAHSGRQALRYLLDQDFAVILLDVMMPDMDGFETATLIRQRERSRLTPIIFLTALGKSEEHLFHGYGVGAVDYLFKPIVPEVLRSKVAVFADLDRKSRLLKRHTETLQQRNTDLERAMAELEKADREIHRLNEHLERRVQDLDSVNKELEAFSYSVSHDLRAPLTRIAGFSQALEEAYATQLDDTGRQYVERVHSSARRMCQLVDDLLNFSRVTRVEMRRESVDMSAMARNIAAELEARDPERRTTFVVADGLQAVGDPAMVRATLLNLIENSWKFTGKRADGCIEVGARMDGDESVFFVRDNGAGFDPALAHKLFNPFQRLHSNAEFEGTGIGLATAERIIRRHGGRIWADGEVDRGATFSFTLRPEV